MATPQCTAIPIQKRGFHCIQHKIGLPYPNYKIGPDELPTLCRCFMVGDKSVSFYVSHQQDMPTLYRDGSFGQSNVTHRGPVTLLEQSHESQYYYRRFKEKVPNRYEKQQKATNLEDTNGKNDESLELKIENHVGTALMEKLKSEDAATILNKVSGTKRPSPSTPTKTPTGSSYSNGIHPTENKEIEERLILLPEEVIFLSFGVGCLSIQEEYSLDHVHYNEVWKTLVQENPDFPFIYAVYHYFRSKNWVPKPAQDLGGDYVLYRVGPDFYHATFVVHIIGLPSRRRPTWFELHTLERVAVSVRKNVLLCEVAIPENFVAADSTPRSVFDLKIRETVVNRWFPFGQSDSDQD